MTHFKQVWFTISKEHDIYIDEVLLVDKKRDVNIQKRQFPNGRSEYIRKLIDNDMSKEECNGKPFAWKPDES